MCTVKDQHQVLVCDVAIGQVRERLTAAFGAAVQYTPVEGQGTLVQSLPSVEGKAFLALTRAAIDDAQRARQHVAAARDGAAPQAPEGEA